MTSDLELMTDKFHLNLEIVTPCNSFTFKGKDDTLALNRVDDDFYE